jgi:hypothetical protein
VSDDERNRSDRGTTVQEITVIIKRKANGELSLQASVSDKVILYGMLEMAKDAIQAQTEQPRSPITIAGSGAAAMLGMNGHANN